MAEKRRGLGRGIGALIPSAPAKPARTTRPSDIFFDRSVDDQEHVKSHVQVSTESAESTTGTPAVTTTSRTAPTQSPESTATDAPTAEPSLTPAIDTDSGLREVPGARYAEVPIDQITANARQPRQVFDEDELDELSASIRELGVLQPVVVRPLPEADARTSEGARYELVMGERRLRASGLAGLTEIPAVIRDTEDTDLLRDALLENLHRAQLNPLEEAAAYQQLLDDFSCTHDELASRIARSRPQITNTLRLLRLPALVQRRVAAGVLSAGHARALLGLEDGAAMERLAQRIVAEGLSVRATEEAVAMGVGAQRPELRRRRAPSAHSEQLDRLATRLSDRLDTRVKVTMGQRKGRITVDFASVDDLDRILGSLAPGESVQSD
jgi:ParB family chromosome partitioning protein